MNKFLQAFLYSIALSPWVFTAIGIYLWLLPPPVRVTYVAPRFVAFPVSSREDAITFAIERAPGGSDVWRWIEFCVLRPYTAHVDRAWVNESMVWHAPTISTRLSRQVGCSSSSIRVPVPKSNPTRSFEYQQTMVIDGPLWLEYIIDYPPIPLIIEADQ